MVVSYYYDNAHFLVTLGLLVYLWWRRADIYRPLRNSLVLINVLGFVVFWRYPVAPPRMLGGFTDVVAATHTFGSWHTGALASQANQLAAMPSLHIAWAVWCTVAVWRLTTRRSLRALAVVYPFLTGFAVLATGNHYVLDIVGGALLAAASVRDRCCGTGRVVAPAARRWRACRRLDIGEKRAATSASGGRVAHVTKLLRSPSSATVAGPSGRVEGHDDGSATCRARAPSASVGWPHAHARFRRQRRPHAPARRASGGSRGPR